MKEKKIKTKKVVKRRLKIKGVFILALTAVIIFLSLKSLIQIKVGNVTVSGNNLIKDTEIIKELGLVEDTKYFNFNTHSACDNLKNNPFIKSCKIKRSLSFNLEVLIEENEPLFYYSYEGKTILSNNAETDNFNPYGLPTMVNFTPENVLKEFVSRLSTINRDIIRSISEIEYSPSTSEDGTPIDEERFMLLMNDGNTVYINNRRMSNLNYYDKIYASIGDKKGIINFDCDYGNYPFKEYEEQS